MKTFSVQYSITTGCDATVQAKSKEDAIKRVREIIGNDCQIESVWEVTHDFKTNKKD